MSPLKDVFRGGLTKRLARNVGFTLIGRAWYILVWFGLTPFVLDKLGPERFGVWSLLFLLSGYLATFDLGLGASVIKYTAQEAADSNWGGLRRTLSEINRIYLLLGILWIAVIVMVHPWIVERLDLPEIYQEEVRVALLVSAFVFAFANLASTGPGVLNGLQRMELSNGLLIAASLPQIAVLVIGLQRGYGLYAVAASTAAQWFTVAIGAWFLLRRIVPQLSWPSFHLSGSNRGWFRFSALMQVSNVLALTQLQIDKVLLTAWVGLRSVAEFELGFRVANAVQSLPVLALSPLLPAFAELEAGGEHGRFRRLWQEGTRMLSVAALGMGACVIPVAPLLVRAWVGPDYPVAEELAPWLLAGFAMNLCTGVATSALRGAGRPGLEIAPMLIALVVHVAVSWLFIGWYGAAGAGPALLLALSLWTVLLLIRVALWSQMHPVKLLVSVLARPLVAAVPGLLLGWWVVARVPDSLLGSRVGIMIGAGLAAGLVALAFVAMWWILGRITRLVSSEEPVNGTTGL